MHSYRFHPGRRLGLAACLFSLAAASPVIAALKPLHSIEGYSGVFSTSSAYITNPTLPKSDKTDVPSVELSYVGLGHDRNLSAFTIVKSLGTRAEVGYGLDRFTLGDLPGAIRTATGVSIGKSAVNLHNFNARYQILPESRKGERFRPAVTVGLHYKTNGDVAAINDSLHGVLQAHGMAHRSGLDATLYATKLQYYGKMPFLYNVGLRSSKAAHVGLLGFTDERKTSLEGSVETFFSHKLAFGMEYRQKPNSYTAIPGLIAQEGDWFTVVSAYTVSDQATICCGYGHLGTVLNHDANASWGIAFKNEF